MLRSALGKLRSCQCRLSLGVSAGQRKVCSAAKLVSVCTLSDGSTGSIRSIQHGFFAVFRLLSCSLVSDVALIPRRIRSMLSASLDSKLEYSGWRSLDGSEFTVDTEVSGCL